MLSIAVLVSGSGTNLQAIIDRAAADKDFGARIAVVLSDRPDVRALRRAAAAGIDTEVIPWSDHPGREAFTKAICDAAESYGAETLVLAGFMRILSPEAIERFPNRILNIHPALLPSFPGCDSVIDALSHGVKVTGVTVHFVDEEVDHGPIIAQKAIAVRPDDTPETLHGRIQAVEHRLYPSVIKALAQGRLRVDGRRVVWS
ncbi:MAG: phosphoribosylglycinamide formyltransferase [Acidimicrobiia bacterium]